MAPDQRLYLLNGKSYISPLVIIPSKKESMYVEPWLLAEEEGLREDIAKSMIQMGIPEEWFYFKEQSPIHDQTLKNITEGFKDSFIVMIFIIMSYLLLSYHNAYVYFLDKGKLLHLRYIYGIPFYKRYRTFWLLIALPYGLILCFVFSFQSFFKEILYLRWRGVQILEADVLKNRILIVVLILLIFDLIMHAAVLRNRERKGATPLKGEK